MFLINKKASLNREIVLTCVINPEIASTDILPGETRLYKKWAVLLAQFDVQYAVNTMACFAVKPREGHLKRMLRVFRYLKYHQKGRIKIDTDLPNYDGLEFMQYDWMEHYPDAF